MEIYADALSIVPNVYGVLPSGHAFSAQCAPWRWPEIGPAPHPPPLAGVGPISSHRFYLLQARFRHTPPVALRFQRSGSAPGAHLEAIRDDDSRMRIAPAMRGGWGEASGGGVRPSTCARKALTHCDGRAWKRWFAISVLSLAFGFWPCGSAGAANAKSLRNELPAPYNLQKVVLKNAITLTWQWPKPEVLPAFKTFGYDIQRQDGKMLFTTDTTFSDPTLAPGSYQYRVRAHGTALEKRQPVTYISDWSEPVQGKVLSACAEPPTVSISVEPTQKAFASVPSLRFHVKGRVSTISGCTLGPVSYHLDSGIGILHSGPLPINTQGVFDTFINAFGPEDEVPSGRVSFTITASASNESGPTTSAPTTVDVELQNPFAPRRL